MAFRLPPVGPSQADVTEGSGGIRERLHYDSAATLHSDCGRGLVPKDAESMGREDKPLLDFSSK